ncbi:FMN-binding protein [Salinibacterium sp.]|uniref:FMN-binding protein n=1 Tax=Salinibacterium sp. TaxID=1915057 RepID=UPI00286AD64A|nr:FMN-binding protein [Salinibacterium sp.]
MRTRAVLGSIFASVAVLVVGWQAGAAVVVTSTATTSAPQASGVTPAPVVGGTPTPAATPTAVPVPAGPADGTYTGASVATRYGSVQVSIAFAGGAITDVAALKLTDADGRSVQISNRAAPLLHDEVLASQSANVSNVTGATYTTRAYLSSVQSALDQAGF